MVTVRPNRCNSCRSRFHRTVCALAPWLVGLACLPSHASAVGGTYATVTISGPLTSSTVPYGDYPINVRVTARGGKLTTLIVSYDGTEVKRFPISGTSWEGDVGPYDATPPNGAAAGAHQVRVSALAEPEPPGGGSSTVSFTVLQDSAPPTLYLEGALYEDRGAPLARRQYDLAIEATDGTAASGSGIARVQVLVDGALRHTALPPPGCIGIACEVDSSDYLLDASNMAGDHRIEVRATDNAGLVTSTAWTATFGGPFGRLTYGPPEGTDPSGGFGVLAVGDAGFGCPSRTRELARSIAPARPTSLRVGSWRDAAESTGPETTETYKDGGYLLTRCTSAGDLIVSRLVGPVPVPGGSTALLPLARVAPEGGNAVGITTVDYLDPSDPAFVTAWAAHREEFLAATPGPTKLLG